MTSLRKLQEKYSEGYDAGMNLIGAEFNPYEEGSDYWRSWETGRVEALNDQENNPELQNRA